MKFTAKQIAAYLHGRIEGNEAATVSTFAKIEEGVPEAISFLANPKYAPYLYTTASAIVLINEDFQVEGDVKPTLIRVSNAYEAIAKLLQLYEQETQKKAGIHPSAVIEPTAHIGEDVYIGAFAYIGASATIGDGAQVYPHVVVGDNASVGKGTILYPHVSIYHGCLIGNQCIIHAGAVIGADGFGFAPADGGYDKIPQIGIVQIEDNVEIGANTCIDRSTMGTTYIRKGVKLDNLVQIAHNVEVGEHTVMSAQVGVAGSTKIGQWCMFGGQVGIVGHAVLGDRVLCGAQAGIAKGIPQGHVTIQGSPAIEAKNFARSSAVFKKLPELYTELNRLTKEIERLKENHKA